MRMKKEDMGRIFMPIFQIYIRLYGYKEKNNNKTNQ